VERSRSWVCGRPTVHCSDVLDRVRVQRTNDVCTTRVYLCGARRGRTRVEGEDAIDAGSRKRTLVDVADKVDQELERVARVVICQAGRQPLRQARGVVGDRAGVAEPGVVAVTVNAVAIVVKGALCLVEARGGVVAHVGEVERGGPPVLSGVCDDVGPRGHV
jgi:hypothetical protein